MFQQRRLGLEYSIANQAYLKIKQQAIQQSKAKKRLLNTTKKNWSPKGLILFYN